MKEMSNQEMKNMFSLEGKVAVVTGGAGSLGEGVATGLALHGADVVVTGRTIETLQSTVKKVEELGKRALAIACDVTNEDQVKAMAKQAMDAFGKIDILVTVAGIAKRFPAEEFPVADFVLIFLNRLSDYFFVLARYESNKTGKEIYWE